YLDFDADVRFGKMSAGQAGGAAAVDGDDRPGDVGGPVRREERGQLGDLFGLAGPLQRRPTNQGGEALGGALAAGHRGLDEAGADGVGPDAVLAVFDGGGLGERNDARLRHRVDAGWHSGSV